MKNICRDLGFLVAVGLMIFNEFFLLLKFLDRKRYFQSFDDIDHF